MKRSLMIIVLCFGALVPAFAQNVTMPAPREDVPDVYVVKKGDTLWDIAETFFGDPFTWPDIWQRNLYIEDPHWIYPGQKLSLMDAIRLLTEPQPEPGPVAVAPEPVSAEPEAAPVIEPLRQPEPQRLEAAPRMPGEGYPASANQGSDGDDGIVIRTLASPQPAYRKESYMRTGFITRRSAIPSGQVLEIDGGFHSGTRNDVITVDLGGGGQVRPGSLLAVMSVGDRVKHPDTGEDLGVVMHTKGIAEIISQGDDQSLCRVIEDFDPIVAGDHVMPVSFADAPEFDAWVRPDQRIDATILAIDDPLLSIHVNDILYIDEGSRAGVRPGDRFTIYGRDDDGGDTGHRTPLGEIQAVNVMTDETAVLVLSMSETRMNVGDRAELTARCRLLY